MAFIVETLDLAPIVAASESEIDRPAKRANVVSDCRLRQTQLASDLGLVESTLEELLNERACLHTRMLAWCSDVMRVALLARTLKLEGR